MSGSQAPVLTIRVARAADAEQVADIYNQGIADRSATFETDPRAPADLVRRIEEDPQRCHALGFREVGTYEKHSRLDGRWLDVVIVERLIPEIQP